MAGIEEDKASARATAGDRLAARRAAKAARKASQRGTTPALTEAVAVNVEAASVWYDGHQRTLWIAAAAIVLFGGGGLILNMHLQKTRGEAASMLSHAIAAAQAPVLAADDVALLDNVDESYPTLQARAEEALTRYEKVTVSFPDSQAAAWAKLGEANALFALGRHEEAEASFQKARAAGTDPYVTARSLEGEALSLAGRQKHAEAITKLEELAKLDNGAYAVLADYQRARVLVALGKREAARELLGKLLEGQQAAAAADVDLSTPEASYETVTESAKALLAELASDAAPLRVELPAAEGETPKLDANEDQLGAEGEGEAEAPAAAAEPVPAAAPAAKPPAASAPIAKPPVAAPVAKPPGAVPAAAPTPVPAATAPAAAAPGAPATTPAPAAAPKPGAAPEPEPAAAAGASTPTPEPAAAPKPAPTTPEPGGEAAQ